MIIFFSPLNINIPSLIPGVFNSLQTLHILNGAQLFFLFPLPVSIRTRAQIPFFKKLQCIPPNTYGLSWDLQDMSWYIYVGTTGRLLAWSHFVCKIPLPTDSLSASITRVERDYLWCVNININIYCDTLLSLSSECTRIHSSIGVNCRHTLISASDVFSLLFYGEGEGIATESRYF